jgi:hypothetical protein
MLLPTLVTLVPDREQSNGSSSVLEVSLRKLSERLLCNLLQRVIHIAALRQCGPSHPVPLLLGVGWDVNLNLATSKPKLVVRVTSVHGSALVVKASQNIPQNSGETLTV